MSRIQILGPCVAALLGLAWSSSATAHNLTHPRTPVDWSDAPCMTVIDRRVEGRVWELDYAIPDEDTMLSPDEPPDSRRHQFFAFCRDHYFEDQNPSWINEADLELAVGLGLGELANVDLEHDVLDNAPRWQGCFARITEDDERRPITFAAAAEPVAWDVGELAAGTWVVEAYTWEPWLNLWTEHPGVFRIVDDDTPASRTPAAALDFDEQVVTVGDEASVRGCVDALPGSIMRLSWAAGGSGIEPEWTPFAVDVPAQSGSFELPFVGPEDAIGRYLLIMLELEDPLGRVWTAYSRKYIGVVAKPPESGGESGESGASGGESGGESGESGPALDAGGAAGGCACASGDDPRGRSGLAPSVLMLVFIFAHTLTHSRK